MKGSLIGQSRYITRTGGVSGSSTFVAERSPTRESFEQRRRTPGYGRHGGMATPMVVEDGNIHLIPGFGDLSAIKSTLYKTRNRQENKVDPVTDIDNWNWITFSKNIEKRLPLLETNGRTYYEVLQDISRTLFCYLGYDQNRNFVFKFKEPKQAVLKNPVSNLMEVEQIEEI